MHPYLFCSCSDCNEYANNSAYEEAFAQLTESDVLEAVDKALISHGKEMMKAVWEEDAQNFWQPISMHIEKQVTRYQQQAQQEQTYYDTVYE